MGAFLNHPKIEKLNDSGDGTKICENFKYAIASMQGWRVEMEDAHHIIISLKDHLPFKNWSFFAVFDGHAGSKVAKYSAEHLLQTFLDTEEFQQIEKELKDSSAKIDAKIKNLVQEGLIKGFMKLDEDMQALHGDEESGTTAVCAILTPEYIFLANLGDSRGILCRKNLELFGTIDHKPYFDKERERIQKAGGSVMIQRVNGSLAVSRALGDFKYKSVPNLPQNEQLVSPEPDIYVIERNKLEDEFLILACDGVFDVVNNEELCELVRSRLKVTQDIVSATNQILDICLSKNSRDNMTMILVVFESAPKLDEDAIKEEKQWNQRLEQEIHNILNSLESMTEPDAEILSNCLKKKEAELALPQPGGIHLARSLIHCILEKKAKQGSNFTLATSISQLTHNTNTISSLNNQEPMILFDSEVSPQFDNQQNITTDVDNSSKSNNKSPTNVDSKLEQSNQVTKESNLIDKLKEDLTTNTSN